MAEDDRQSLERTISVGGSALLSFNGLLGAAIFALPATLLADWGSFSPWLFLIVAVAALLVIVPFTLSAAAFTESGGPATYGRVFGRFTGFELGWIYYVAKLAGFAANLNVLADYVARWWAGAGDGIGRIATTLVAWTALMAVNLFGMRRALAVLGGFTLLKALPLLVVAVAALFLFGPPPAPILPSDTSSLEAGFLVIFYAFVGFENAVVPTGETKDPSSTLPRAVGLTILVTALLYFVVQLGFVTAFDGTKMTSKAPIIDLGAMVAGAIGVVVLTPCRDLLLARQSPQRSGVNSASDICHGHPRRLAGLVRCRQPEDPEPSQLDPFPGRHRCFPSGQRQLRMARRG